MAPRHLGLLALGVVAVSFSAILIRLADAPPFAVAFYRNALAAAVLLPIAVARHRSEFRRLTGVQVRVALLAGGLLALHFATWIPSLSYTSIAASTVLVTTQPVWVALGGLLLLGERVSRPAALGITLALAGAVIVSGGDFSLSARALVGDGLALIGAVCAAGYYLGGRSLRRDLSLLTYVGIVYTTCAILLIPAMLAAGTPFGGYDGRTWLLFAGMALIPHILGHTVFNYLLRYVETSVVAVAIMGEPVGATLLGLAFFGEVPPWSAAVGGAVILGGIYLAVTGQAQRMVEEAPIE
jgi:drug/metabolite transporter (DMT)-like permease